MNSSAEPGLIAGAPLVVDVEGAGRWRLSGPRLAARDVWPSDVELPLLRALVGREAEAAGRWRRWCDAGGLDRLTPRVQQLLPSCYARRHSLEPGAAELATLKRAYLASWAKNRRLFECLHQLIELLRQRDCPGVVLKGAALAPLYYGDLAARSMGDVDLLVPEARFAEVVNAMMARGWRPLHHHPERFDARFCHAIAMLNDHGTSVDLHCHVVSESCEPDADREFWEGAVPFRAEGLEALTLCASDHLVHACAHGVWWVENPPLRWVVDVAMILRSCEGGIDWNRVLRQAQARGVGLRVGKALHVLLALGLQVPPDVADRLTAEGGWLERRRLRLAAGSSRGRPVRLLGFHWMMYRRGLMDRGELGKLAGLPRYLRFSTQTPSLLRVPIVLAEKGIKAIAHRFGFYQYWNSE
jgi:hypothetical protein